MNWTYTTIMAAAVITGLVLFRRMREPSDMNGWQKMAVGLGAFCGGMIGAKLPFVLADWQGFLDGTAWFDDGKTIMAGLVGGYLGAQVAEWALDIRTRTCDNFAVPVAVAVAIGRLGCFSAGCCHGTETSLPWAVVFRVVDNKLRHPTQLYESAFHFLAAIVLYQMQRRGMLRGHLIRVYLIAYFAYRFATEFIRPEEQIWFGLTGYQLAALVLMPFFAFWCCPGYRPWSKKSRPRKTAGHLPKATRALCPTCLKRMPGTTFERDGKVYLRRECPQHGASESLVSSDRRHYYLRDEVPHPPHTDEPCCSTTPGHASCVALLEVTGECNLRCPACYAQSPNGGHRPIEELCADLDTFLAERGELDILQLSGGEPLLHPDLLQIVDHCKTLPIERIMINTNGLELLRSDTASDTLAAELARRKPGVELYLQFDGLDTQSHIALRGTDILAQKRAVLEKIIQHDLPTTLVCAVAGGVNEDQLGPLLRLGLDTPQLRGITFQPATYAGRFDLGNNGLDRVTLADVIRLLVQQSEGLFTEDDFQPLPCSNPNCCSFTFVARRRGKRPLPLTRIVDYEEHLDQLADRMNFSIEDARTCCNTVGGPEEFFRVVIKPFMDADTYDQDRIDECCVHVIRPGGKAVSFCEFNTLLRGRRLDSPSTRRVGTAHQDS